MLKTATAREKLKLKALQKGKLPKIDVPEYMGIRIYQGTVEITDYSEKDDRNCVIALLNHAGIQTEVETESWCG